MSLRIGQRTLVEDRIVDHRIPCSALYDHPIRYARAGVPLIVEIRHTRHLLIGKHFGIGYVFHGDIGAYVGNLIVTVFSVIAWSMADQIPGELFQLVSGRIPALALYLPV